MDSEKMNKMARQYADGLEFVSLTKLASEEDVGLTINNMRFMAFAAGYRAGYEAARAEQVERTEAGERE